MLQKNAGNNFTLDEFSKAVLASNPGIININVVQAGQIIYIPEKIADGSIAYNNDQLQSKAITDGTTGITTTTDYSTPTNILAHLRTSSWQKICTQREADSRQLCKQQCADWRH